MAQWRPYSRGTGESRTPDKKAALQALYDRWNASMQPPRWEDRRWDGHDKHQADKRQKTDREGKDRKKRKERG